MEESPVMKAFREFASADPNNCDREWEACLALGRDKATASISPSTNSTPPVHNHVHGPAVVPASSTTRSTASLHATSSAISTTTPAAAASALTATRVSRSATKDELSPGARHIYDLLVGGSVAPDSSTSLRASSSAIPTDDHEPAAATSTPASALDVSRARSTSDAICTRAATATCVPTATADLRPVTPSTCSMLGLDDSNGGEDPMDTSLTPWSAPPSSNAPPDDLARPLSAPMGVLELFMLSPSTCLTECPGSHVGALPAVCLTPHATLSPATSSVAVTAVQRHVMMSTTGEKLEIGEAPMSMEDTLQIVPIPADVSGSNMELTLMSPASYFTGCSNGAVASTESNHSVADTAQSIINVERVDLAIVTVPRNMTLTAISAVAGQLNTSLLAGVAIQNGSSVSLEPNSCIFSKVFAEKYSVTAVVPRSLILVVTCDEAVLWPILQSATSSTDLLLPWDPGQPWYGGGTKLGTLEDEFASGVACLQGKSMHQLFNCSLVVEMVKKWTIALVELLQILPILGSYCLTSNHYQWVPELLQFHSLLDSWFHFEPAGKASLYGYNAAQFQWEIAWPTTTQTQSLIASTSMDRLLDLLLARRDIVQQSTSLSGFIAILNGEAEVQWNYSCTRILTDNVLKEWIYRHILRILMEACSPCVVPGRGYNWQMLGSTTENTTMILQFLHILRGNTHHSEIKPPWPPPLGMCLNLRIGNIPSSHGRVVVISLCTASVLRYLNRGNSIVEPKPPWSLLVTTSSNLLTWFLHVKIPSELTAVVCKSEFRFYTPGYILFLCCALVQWKPWTSGVYFWLSASACRPDVPIHLLLQFAIQNCLASQEFYSSIKIGKLHDLELGTDSRSIHYLEVCILDATFTIHAARLYWLLGLHYSLNPYVAASATGLGSQFFEWQNPWHYCYRPPFSSSSWLQMHPTGDHWTLKPALLFSWDITGTFASLTATKHISEAWVLYIPGTCIMQCGSDLMPWVLANSRDGILTYNTRVLISWDPVGSVLVLDAATGANWNSSQPPFLHLIWDPGGYKQRRLEGKPNLKEGGLSTTPSLLGLARTVGCICWAWACLEATGGSHYKYEGGDDNQRGLDRTDGPDGGFGEGPGLG